MRILVPLLLLLAAGPALASSTCRIDWSSDAEDRRVSVKMLDLDDNAMVFAKPVTLVIEAEGGEISRDGQEWGTRVAIPVTNGKEIRQIKVRGKGISPVKISLTATADAENVHAYSTHAMTIPPHWVWSLLAAMVGGVIWSIFDFLRALKRGRFVPLELLAGLGLGIVLGSIAFILAQIEAVWNLVGIKPDAVKPQSYVCLGLILSALGVDWLLDKIFGRTSGKPDWVDAVGEKLEGILYDGKYLVANPSALPRVKSSLREATFPHVEKELYDYLGDRMESVFKASYRRNFTAIIEGAHDGTTISWKEEDSYVYVVSPDDPATDPEVMFAYEDDIPDAHWNTPLEELERFGTVVRELKLICGTDDLGYLTYVSQPGTKELRLQDAGKYAGEPDLDPKIDVTFGRVDEDETPQISFRYQFRFPKKLRAKGEIHVYAEGKWDTRARDDVYFLRLSKLTHDLTVQCTFEPKARVETVKYEWKRATEEPPLRPGIAQCHGWLLPGNGVCVAWYGVRRPGT